MPARLSLTALEDRTAPSATLIKDINRSTDFGSFAALGDSILFVQSTTDTGAELWRTDGTPGGTSLVKDILPGAQSSNPNFYQTAGGLLYFTVTTAAGGQALWRTDGTTAGTILVKTIASSPISKWVEDTVEFKGQLFFSTYYSGHPSQLWKTDGTPGGTRLLKTTGWTTDDPLNDMESDPITELTVVGDTLYFTAENRAHGEQLWKTDGTGGGTVEVPYLVPQFNYDGVYTSGPFRLTAFKGELYFAQKGEEFIGFNVYDRGIELWKTDGTREGTSLLKDINAGSNNSSPGRLTVVGDTMYFAATNGSSVNGSELWKTDGTTNGTTMVKDIRPGTAGSSPLGYPGGGFVSFNDKVYFTADDGTSGREWWTSDGTSGGTVRLRDITPGTPGTAIGSISLVNGSIYFVADDGSTGPEVWKSDGTPGGTNPLVDLEPGPEGSFPWGIVGLGSDVYWFANTLADGQALWKSDGTPGNATSVVSTPGHSTVDSGSGTGATLDGLIYFAANGRLWRTDGTAAGTVPVTGSTPSISSNAQLTVFNGAIYFQGFATAGGTQMWKFDGTTASVFSAAPNGSDFLVIGNAMYFKATSAASGTELWVTDGTPGNTHIVKEIGPGNASGLSGQGLIAFNGEVYFTASDGTTGYELWKSNGADPGTARLKDIYPGTQGGAFWLGSFAAQAGGNLFFWATDPDEGNELWKTNGTEAGTIRVTDMAPGVNQDGMSPLTEMGGDIYFFRGFASAMALWKVDGTTGAVSQVKKIPVPTWFSPSTILSFNGRLYFVGSDGKKGTELWTSDGTADGTHVFVDIVPGTKSAFRLPVYGDPYMDYMSVDPVLTPAGNGFLFHATDGKALPDGTVNYTVWWSDGTSDGTRRIMNGALGGSSLLGQVGNSPILRLSWPEFGTEPTRYDPIVTTSDNYSLEDGLRLDVPAATGVLANDTDGAGRPASAVLETLPAHGWVTLRADGSFTYQPFNGDFSGTDAFTYRAAGPIEKSAPTTVTIDVDLANQAPIAENDAATGRAGKAVTVNVLSNDRDPDHDSLVIDSFTQGINGTVRLVRYTLRYTPNLAGALTDTFTYTVRDARGETATATVTVTLIPTPAPKVTAVRVFPGSSASFVNLVRPGRKVLPFAQLSRVEIAFAADVAISADDLRLFGEAGGFYSLSGFAYDAVTHTASWQIGNQSAGQGNDRLRFLLDGSLSSGVLDGLGNPIGDRVWSIGLLAGDYNGNGQVTATDVTGIKRQIGRAPTGGRRFADLNGDGVIDQVDVDLAAANLGMRL